ncbi:MAG: MFS transporter [Candidatus Rokubacteria bacterium 13_1_20CM_2_70_7]|nr:MAG: MFS transporter [Candidatus Rokubacteria bacterium 13_1_20CM_2_70_7]
MVRGLFVLARGGAVPSLAGRTASGFVVMIGVISLFADMTYEGARSVTGPFLAVLGASAAVVGVVAGFGELIGYAVRLVSGYLGDRTRKYWTITLWGYALNMVAVPLLALAGRWETAALLMIAERLGKAIRTPPRDVLLSHAAAQMGRGWAFGLHEALDQIGAVAGPLLVAAILYAQGGYRWAFGTLLVPALLALAFLVAARLLYPQPRDFEPAETVRSEGGFPRIFWIYLASVAFLAAGYADFPLIAYHLKKVSVAADGSIPLLYALAMAVDAVAALVLGRLFDARGLPILIVVPLLSCLFAPLVFSHNLALVVIGTALWGVGMGAQESIVRAAIAAMIPADRRGTAYGVFNSVYGIAWFAGSALMGILYDISIPALIAFSVISQLAAVPILSTLPRANGLTSARGRG